MSDEDLGAPLRLADRTDDSPVILHAPHGSTLVPPSCRAAFTVPDAELAAELERMTDHATDRLVERVAGVSTVVHGLSRLVVDVERFEGDAEEMLAVGMGVLYTHGSQRQPLRSVGAAERARLLAVFHAYGQRFADLVDRAVQRHGRAVIVDVHSYPAEPLPYELHSADRRPELCIGTDARHTPHALVDAVRAAFDGWECALDQPFRGTYVPLRRLGDPRVASVMLEIRRDRYRREGVDDERAIDGIVRRIEALVEDLRATER